MFKEVKASNTSKHLINLTFLKNVLNLKIEKWSKINFHFLRSRVRSRVPSLNIYLYFNWCCFNLILIKVKQNCFKIIYCFRATKNIGHNGYIRPELFKRNIVAQKQIKIRRLRRLVRLKTIRVTRTTPVFLMSDTL